MQIAEDLCEKGILQWQDHVLSLHISIPVTNAEPGRWTVDHANMHIWWHLQSTGGLLLLINLSINRLA